MSEILTTDREAVRAHSQVDPEVPWQQAMRRAIRDSETLCQRLGLPNSLAGDAAGRAFPTFVPLEFLQRIKPGDARDPLLRQVLAAPKETEVIDGFGTDPLAESTATASAGLLQKYAGRALLVTTGACAVHCRYCFRRHFPYETVPKGRAAWEPTLKRLAADQSIREVLLSGGDPLTLVDASLAELFAGLHEIAHLRRIRIHTRLPIVIPQRITEPLLRILTQARATVWMVVHCNHAAELDAATLRSLGRMVDAGIPVLNQAVLLRGVNDSVAALEELCERLIDHRVQPYYLHQLDRVAGAAHFEVPETAGEALIAELRQRLPGYAVPTYVREVPGEASKTPVVETHDSSR